jgi:hypothetical protein
VSSPRTNVGVRSANPRLLDGVSDPPVLALAEDERLSGAALKFLTRQDLPVGEVVE